jgi:hypothetical protein
MIPTRSYRLQCDTNERGRREREKEGGRPAGGGEGRESIFAQEMQESVDCLLGGWMGTANVYRNVGE